MQLPALDFTGIAVLANTVLAQYGTAPTEEVSA